MEMVIKIDSEAFLASLKDVMKQIQEGQAQITWTFSPQMKQIQQAQAQTRETVTQIETKPQSTATQTGVESAPTATPIEEELRATAIQAEGGATSTATQIESGTTSTEAQTKSEQTLTATQVGAAHTPTARQAERERPALDKQGTEKAHEEANYTLEEVRARLAKLFRKGEGKFVKALLARYGVTRLTQIAPKDYIEIMKEVGERDEAHEKETP